MMQRTTAASLRCFAITLSLSFLAAPAFAADPMGTWLRDTGASRIRFAKCGSSLCGTVVWLKDKNSASRIGQRVFFDMAPDGDNRWIGKAFNPEDGKTYSGKVFLDGDQLITSGCVIGALICKSVNWRRSD
jgi:uncharacterized protein (DUF2147 family)